MRHCQGDRYFPVSICAIEHADLTGNESGSQYETLAVEMAKACQDLNLPSSLCKFAKASMP